MNEITEYERRQKQVHKWRKSLIRLNTVAAILWLIVGALVVIACIVSWKIATICILVSNGLIILNILNIVESRYSYKYYEESVKDMEKAKRKEAERNKE